MPRTRYGARRSKSALHRPRTVSPLVSAFRLLFPQRRLCSLLSSHCANNCITNNELFLIIHWFDSLLSNSVIIVIPTELSGHRWQASVTVARSFVYASCSRITADLLPAPFAFSKLHVASFLRRLVSLTCLASGYAFIAPLSLSVSVKLSLLACSLAFATQRIGPDV